VNRRNRIASLALVASAVAFTVLPLTPAAAASMQTLSTSDKTASVQVPAGWKLVKGLQGFMSLTGPQGETVNLGVLVVVKNAAAGTPATPAVFSFPYSATLKDKFTAIVEGAAKKAGTPVPQVTFLGETPAKLPMCSILLGGMTAGSEQTKFEGIICSLAPDYLGFYKNVVSLASVPASLAAQDRPVVEQIAASYRVSPDTFKKMIAPYTAAPPRPVTGAGAMPAPVMAPYQDPTNSDCFDYNVIRQSPPWEVPMHCGGHMPG
jgi:hypothetical protein